MRCSTHTILGCVLALLSCSEVTGIEALPCEPGCKDETTRIFCDAAGNAQTEVCPSSIEECAAPACEAGACTFEPAIGALCGETGGAQCNEGFACMGGNFHLSAIRLHTCLATDDGKVWCWGDNTYRELGDGTNRPGLHPVLVRGLPGHAVQVIPGYAHTCALLQTGEVSCWGNNLVGQCGVPGPEPVSAPALVEVPEIQFTSVAAGQGHTCAIAEDKTVYCWGNTSRGQCGSDPAVTGEHNVGPAKVPGLDSVEAISAVKNHTCAVRSTSPSLVCWGSNSYLGDPAEGEYVNNKLGPAAGDLMYSAAPIPVDVGAPVVDVGMGYESTYAVTGDGRVFGWGRNNRLQIGTQSQEKIIPAPTPVLIETPTGRVPLTGVKSLVRSDGSDMCAQMVDQLAFGTSFLCWGADDWGEIGVGTQEGARTTHPFPVPVRALPPHATWLARGEDHACGPVDVNNRTEIWCFGRPGALGNGTKRADDTEPATQWQGTPVVWDPDNFAPALE